MKNPNRRRGPAYVIFNEVYGTFVCVCGALSDFENCTLPAYHECPKCKRFFDVMCAVVNEIMKETV